MSVLKFLIYFSSSTLIVFVMYITALMKNEYVFHPYCFHITIGGNILTTIYTYCFQSVRWLILVRIHDILVKVIKSFNFPFYSWLVNRSCLFCQSSCFHRNGCAINMNIISGNKSMPYIMPVRKNVPVMHHPQVRLHYPRGVLINERSWFAEDTFCRMNVTYSFDYAK